MQVMLLLVHTGKGQLSAISAPEAPEVHVWLHRCSPQESASPARGRHLINSAGSAISQALVQERSQWHAGKFSFFSSAFYLSFFLCPSFFLDMSSSNITYFSLSSSGPEKPPSWIYSSCIIFSFFALH